MRYLLFILLVVGGCANPLLDQHAKIIDQMRGVATEAAERIGSGGMGAVQAGGGVNDPGIRVGAGVEYYAYARFVGVFGQVMASMQGVLDREVPDSVRSDIMRIFMSTDLNEQQKSQAIWDLITIYIKTKIEENTDLTSQPATQPS